MREIKQKNFKGERPLFNEKNIRIYDCVFGEGESPLKECRNIEVYNSLFKWKYPFWYGKDIKVKDCTLYEMARAGVWYTENISFENTVIEAPKNFRRSSNITFKNVTFSNGDETLWNCKNVNIDNVTARGDYFAMNCENVKVSNFTHTGNYSFDGAKNVEIRNSKIISKDAFWNSENVTVYNSFVSGEYLGWNARNLTLVDCTVESLQGMCYIDNIVMKNCRLLDTTLAFEYSKVYADIKGGIKSVFNPSEGYIKADHIDELIMDKDKVDIEMTTVVCSDELKRAN